MLVILAGCKRAPSEEEVAMDRAANLKDILRTATAGDADAQHDLANLYQRGEVDVLHADPVKAIEWWTKAAEQGHVESQMILGAAYYEGRLVLQNYDQSLHWYMKAAEAGHAPAQVRLGLSYRFGQGVAVDLEASIGWFLESAMQGNLLGMRMAEVAYYHGQGVEPDPIESYAWHTVATYSSSSGDLEGVDVPNIEHTLSQADIRTAQHRAAALHGWIPSGHGEARDIRPHDQEIQEHQQQ